MSDTAATARTGTLRLVTSFPWFQLYYHLFKPRVSIDGGEEQQIGWGENALQLPPGQHQITVRTKWVVIPVGAAATTVTVPDGGSVALAYRAPWFTLGMPGKLTQT
jgi:hypothetical protein